MEKLITLLNEYEKKRIEAVNAKGLPFNIKLSFRPYTERDLTNEAYRSCWLEICSKYYGFIKRLADNDKIDYYLVGKKGRPCLGFYRDYEILLMLLAISDTPIEDLISYLK